MDKFTKLNPILEILKSSPQRVSKILIQKDKFNKRIKEIITLAKGKNVPVVFVPKSNLDQKDSSHQGIIALLSFKEYCSIEEILTQSPLPFLVILDGIEDPRNLGAIIRSAEGAKVDGIILPERRSVGLTETVAITSAGAIENVKIARVKNLSRLIDQLKEKDIWVIGAEAGQEEYWYEFDYTLPIALVFGSEGKGLHRIIRKKCDKILSIPLLGEINSLNISVAASIFLFEVTRQRMSSKNSSNN
ncbi:MAG: 23S rRNA (guanosine(2251)-2'-O)-methyltransferase RlmB [Candidatus Aminicenantia bacterium]